MWTIFHVRNEEMVLDESLLHSFTLLGVKDRRWKGF